MYVHALHAVHALPDLRLTAGRFAGRFLRYHSDASLDKGTRLPDQAIDIRFH
jgi:hypothetical protein